ncbi:hypothetical protein PoB_003957000 [Plakobranchus ocellatus]|uniref:Uncharacterized protein n=1 Tax=Plakobranchus ocellatus TaxID=259542 RepID=A0AAV4B1W5_9GAST|nr:hypothetical protein PoB_003957000 [Plakobranchus ocellatus]
MRNLGDGKENIVLKPNKPLTNLHGFVHVIQMLLSCAKHPIGRAGRDRIVVSTSRCGRDNPGPEIPSHPFSFGWTQRSNEKFTWPRQGFDPRESHLVANYPTKYATVHPLSHTKHRI